MMIKNYDFDYNCGEGRACFIVDTEKFNTELTREYLDFFTWDYDEDEDPIDALMKKYAMQAIRISTLENYNEFGVISWFADAEGFPLIDGSIGIKLTQVEGYEFDDYNLFVLID
ncbi:hypothetical protein ACVWYG_002556 [Pedobacter sp. UYEF25]